LDVRRFLWILVIVAFATMLTTLVADRYYKSRRGPDPAAPAVDAAPGGASAAPTKSAPDEPAPKADLASAGPAAKPAPGEPRPGPDAATTGPATETAPVEATSAPAREIPVWDVPLQPVREVYLGSLDQRTKYKFQVQLTSRGAAVKTLKLSEHFVTVQDKRRYEKDPDTYLQAVKENPALEGNYSLLNPVSYQGRVTLPLATRRVYFPNEPAHHRTLNLSDSRWEVGEVTTDADGAQQVDFTAVVKRNGAEYVRLVKTYTVRKGSYSVEVALRAENLSAQEVQVQWTQFAGSGVPREDVQHDQRYVAYGKIIKGEIEVPKLEVSKLKGKETGLGDAKNLGGSVANEPTIWAGLANKFFACLAYVKPAAGAETISAPSEKADYRAGAIRESEDSSTYLPFVELGPYELKADKPHQVKMDVFAGAKDRDLFVNTPLYKKLDYEGALNFGSCFCVVTPIVLGLMRVLEFLGGLLHNYGLAIIVLVAVVRLLLHPLTKKGQVSMMAMQKLQPQMEKLKQQYANDKQKLQSETMKLYKTAGFTPILGCLPMLLQMPIWIALYRGLQSSVALRHAPFLPIWITDLAAPDALITFSHPLMGGYTFPMVGVITSFNLLPILLAVAMFLQQKFSPQAAASAGDQKQATQKQMMYFMTVFFLLIFYNMPSGLNLYIMTSTFAGVAEQYFIRKHIRERQAAEAAAETKVSMPGKRFRGQKPKKPKPPFKM